MVRIGASQALDPGSIPGCRTFFISKNNEFLSFYSTLLWQNCIRSFTPIFYKKKQKKEKFFFCEIFVY